MSIRLSWSSAATFFSTSSDVLARISAKSLPTSVRRSWSICRICSSVSVILPLVWAMDDTKEPRSPSSRTASRSSAVTARDWDQVLVPELAHPLELVPDQDNLAPLGRDLVDHALDLLVQLSDALLQLRLLALARRAAQLEKARLVPEQARNLRLSPARGQLGGEAHPLPPVLFGLETGLPGRELVHALCDHGEVGACDGLVQAHQDVPGPDRVAIPHPQLADHTAGRVLDLLHVRVHDERAGRNHRTSQFRGGGPAPETEHEQACCSGTADQGAAHRAAGLLMNVGAHQAAPATAGSTGMGKTWWAST